MLVRLLLKLRFPGSVTISYIATSFFFLLFDHRQFFLQFSIGRRHILFGSLWESWTLWFNRSKTEILLIFVAGGPSCELEIIKDCFGSKTGVLRFSLVWSWVQISCVGLNEVGFGMWTSFSSDFHRTTRRIGSGSDDNWYRTESLLWLFGRSKAEENLSFSR